MGRERKRDDAPAQPEGAIAYLPGGMEMRPGGVEREAVGCGTARPTARRPECDLRDEPGAELSRWFLPVDRSARDLPVSKRPRWFALALACAALVLIVLARGIALRVLLPLALAAAAIALLWRSQREARLARQLMGMPVRDRAADATGAIVRRGLELREHHLSFHSAPPGMASGPSVQHFVLSASAPFGVTLVATRRRDRLVAAITTAAGTFYVGASFDDAERRQYAGLLARASVVSNDEAGLEAVAPDGEPLELGAADLVALLGSLSHLDAGSADRLLLSDARGAPVTLEGHELRVRDLRFDLTVPLDWRAIVFQEPFGQAVAIYQGTWIRQAAAEVVLISLLPSIAPLGSVGPADTIGLPELDRATVRDLRLMQATPEEPPPADQRVAIDRIFMLPLRAALDRAPRPATQPTRARA
jgi:hypothetical protein